MTCSPARRAANRANAQSSTGPKTTRGKARSSQNGTTHGFASQSIRLSHSDRARLCRFRVMWRDHFHNRTPSLHQVIEQGALATLMLERAEAVTLHHARTDSANPTTLDPETSGIK